MSDTFKNTTPAYDINNTTITISDAFSAEPSIYTIDPNTLTAITTHGYGSSGILGNINDTITLGDYNWTTHNTLDVKGDANFDGDLIIKGKSLAQTLENIEDKLAILRPNDALEEKWEQLRELRRQYMELEKDIIEKERIWEILKR